MERTLLTVVVPVFNEMEVLPKTIERLLTLSHAMLSRSVKVEVIFVDDGSVDDSVAIIRQASEQHHTLKLIQLSRNFGHQAAVTAGLDYAGGDYVALLDADLQDPPELLVQMYDLMMSSECDVVYGKRTNRRGETLFKRATASIFYRVLSYLCDIDIPRDTGDFRLMSRRAVDAFSQMRESARFVRGLVPWVGFRSIPLEYERHERAAGQTKYPLSKMLSFAGNAVMSFSTKPMLLVIRAGLAILLGGLIFAAYVLYLRLFTTTVVPGFTVTILMMAILSGVQIVTMGILGAYIGKIFQEVKRRPIYVVDSLINL